MPFIFISYRRNDSAGTSRRINKLLVKKYGKEEVFFDEDSIHGGDFRAGIEKSIVGADVMFVIIGPHWIDIKDKAGHRRLDDSQDLVRREVEWGLRHVKRNIVPVLVNGASMPDESELPGSIRELAFKNAVTILADDTDEIILKKLERVIEIRRFPWRKVLLALVVIGMLLAGIGFLAKDLLFAQPDDQAIVETLPVLAAIPTTFEAPSQTPLTPTEAPITETVLPSETPVPLTATLTLVPPTQTSLPTVTPAVPTATATLTASVTPIPPTETPMPPIVAMLPAGENADSPEAIAYIPPLHNRDWTPHETVIKDMTMVLVPMGCFMMGSNTANHEERPAHQVCIDRPFWLGKYEVTNAEFAEFIEAGGYQNRDYWTDDGWQRRHLDQWLQPYRWGQLGFKDPNQPVMGVSWYEAMAYATWRGGRLPTESEWEYAARGPESWAYPWPGNFSLRNVVFSGSGSGSGGNVVGSRPAGASWVGALDMLGNAYEWTVNADYPYPFDPSDGRTDIFSDRRRILRGGSWFNDINVMRTTYRLPVLPDYRTDYYGFRIVMPVD